MPTYLSEKQHTGAFILSEDDDGRLSRDNIVLASGAGSLLDGTIIGKVTIGAVTSAAKTGGNTGNGTLVLDATTPFTLTGATSSAVGVYTVRFITATSILVTNPRGISLGTYAIGGVNGNSVTINNHLKFVVTQAATVFVAGDGFDITVAAGSGKYKASAATALDGSDVPAGFLIGDTDATSADKAAVILARHAEVNNLLLKYDASLSTTQLKAAKLAALPTTLVVR